MYPPKVGGIVRVHRDEQTVVQHPLQGVGCQILDHRQLEIGKRADRQRYLVPPQAGNQCRVFQCPVAVIDPLNSEHVQRFPDVGRRALLTGVGREGETLFSGGVENPLEL